MKKKKRTATEEFLFKLNKLMNEYDVAIYDTTKIFVGHALIEISKSSELEPLAWRKIRDMVVIK